MAGAIPGSEEPQVPREVATDAPVTAESFVLTGVALLADRPVRQHLSALTVALVALVLAGLAYPVVHALYETLDREPTALAILRGHADPAPVSDALGTEGLATPRPLVIVLIDGLRLDEARRLRSWHGLTRRGASAVVDLPLPTSSRPYYHALLTGVPPSGSGVRRNTPGQRAVLDSLADRVRARGGRVAFVAEGLDWMAVMHGVTTDLDYHDDDALGGPLDEVLRTLRDGHPPLLTLVHVLGVDSTAHDGGSESDVHRRALDEADEVVSRVMDAVDRRFVTLAVVSDHGHIAAGGHGGDEREVRRVPFVLVGDQVRVGEATRTMSVEELAPTLARAMHLPPPRAAVADATDAFDAPGASPAPSRQAVDLRRQLLVRATAHDDARRRARHTWMLALAGLAVLMGLGAIKRAFSGFDLGTLGAPTVAASVVYGAHVWLLGRPLSMSALDDATRQGVRLAVVGFVAALLGIGTSALLSRAGVKRRGEGLETHLRRAAAALVWASASAAVVVIAWLGGALGPWPLSAFAYYAPILVIASGAGACTAAALVLFGTIVRRRMEI